MGFSVDPEKIPKGELIYRNKFGKLRPPRYKKFAMARKTYFDDDGNSYTFDEKPYQVNISDKYIFFGYISKVTFKTILC